MQLLVVGVLPHANSSLKYPFIPFSNVAVTEPKVEQKFGPRGTANLLVHFTITWIFKLLYEGLHRSVVEIYLIP